MERDVVVVGESLVDIVRSGDGTVAEYPGGSACNVAVALARLDRPVRFVTAYADDERGRLVAAHLERAGVRLAADPHVIDRTSAAEATIQADGSARYRFDLDWHIASGVDAGAPRVVHTCSLGAVLDPGGAEVLALVTQLREHATVTYDVNARPAITGTGPETVAAVERVVRVADVVKASDEDLEALWPDASLEDAARGLLWQGPAAVVVTRGAAGSVWFGRDTTVEHVSAPVQVADTIGAGDTFQAGLVDALWERDLLGADRRDALRAVTDATITDLLAHAARAAAVTVSRPGADPPYRREL